MPSQVGTPIKMMVYFFDTPAQMAANFFPKISSNDPAIMVFVLVLSSLDRISATVNESGKLIEGILNNGFPLLPALSLVNCAIILSSVLPAFRNKTILEVGAVLFM